MKYYYPVISIVIEINVLLINDIIVIGREGSPVLLMIFSNDDDNWYYQMLANINDIDQ